MIEKILSLLVPPFLHKLDRYLLLNHPRWWAGKFHYFIFYGLLANLCVAGLVLLTPFPLNQLKGFFGSWVISLSFVVEIGLFIFWLYIQSFFSVEQQYGDTKPTVAWVETALYTICVLLIFSPTVVMFVTGVHKAAYEIKIRGHNICKGPLMLEFYQDNQGVTGHLINETQKNNLHKALTLAAEGIITGKVKKIIGIESAIFDVENPLYSVGPGDLSIGITLNEIIHVESGSAEMVMRTGIISIKHGENISTHRSGEKVTVMAGDEIKLISDKKSTNYHDEQFYVVAGEIFIRSSNQTHIATGEGVILKEGEKINLITGEMTVDTYSPIWKFAYISDHSSSSSFVDGITEALITCEYVKYFSNDINAYLKYDIFGFESFVLLNIISIILGVFFTVILKQANWRILIYSFIYLLLLYAFTAIFTPTLTTFVTAKISLQNLRVGDLLLYFYNASLLNLNLDGYGFVLYGLDLIGVSLSFLIVTVLFILFALIQSIKLIKTRKYKLFQFMNFVSLPIALGYLIYILLRQIQLILKMQMAPLMFGNNRTFNWYQTDILLILILSVFFLCYLFFAPILKKILTYIISLPRE